ncbi:MAG TPA: hypothetical protein VN520_14880 [Streptomyces sp.]|uniref:hypothetical protein n=1 Tax=Streptomyces sp. TaxID=1931 RepID=UPI002BE67575|nr:hypothetical protein [Streptomyces sp.]HWU07642.1 hypothetical protein [Streptomyces sp.]
MTEQRAPAAAHQPEAPPAGGIAHRAVATPWVRWLAAERGIRLDGPETRGRRITAADLDALRTPDVPETPHQAPPISPPLRATAQVDLTSLTSRTGADSLRRTAHVAEALVRVWRHAGLMSDSSLLRVVHGEHTGTIADPGTLSADGVYARLGDPESGPRGTDVLSLVDLSDSRVTSLAGGEGPPGRGVLTLGAARPAVTALPDGADGHVMAVRTVAALTYEGGPDADRRTVVAALDALVDLLEGRRP